MDRRILFQAVGAVVLLTTLQFAWGAEPTDWFREARWGVMTHYLGAPSSSNGGAELTAEQIVTYTRSATDKGGVIAYDVPIQKSGLIPHPFVEQLRVVGQAMKGQQP